MRIKIGEILSREGKIDNKDIEETLLYQKTSRRKFGEILLHEKKIEEIDLAKAIASQMGIPYVELSEKSVDSKVVNLFPLDLAEKYTCLPLAYNEPKTLKVTFSTSFDPIILADLRFATEFTIFPCISTKTSIQEHLPYFYGVEKINEIADVSKKFDIELLEEDITSEEEKLDELIGPSEGQAPTVKLVNALLFEAVRREASDIHFEPRKNFLQIKLRIDGVMKKLHAIPKNYQAPIISRIKIMAKLDINERRLPQDGKIQAKINRQEYDFRISTLPTNHGEKIVVRILSKNKNLFSIYQIGLEKQQSDFLLETICKPQGMILVTGPTGSGKTTTLYSILAEINNESINIVTIEDPIEYEIDSINQVQVQESIGRTFANCLRSVLRQDPNVIMVGEIRDEETASVAFRAAQTGHLVLSTLHTNSSIDTITRLFDIGIAPFLVSNSIICIIAQRLVRKNCEHCMQEYHPDPKAAARLGLDPDLKFVRGIGCKKCDFIGYKGRIGIYEILRLSPKIKSLIHESAANEEIKIYSKEEGMSFLLDEAARKVMNYETTVEEVFRVIDIEDQKAKCPKCLNYMEKDFQVCPICKYRIFYFCSSCGKKIKNKDWKLCPYCGGDLHNMT